MASFALFYPVRKFLSKISAFSVLLINHKGFLDLARSNCYYIGYYNHYYSIAAAYDFFHYFSDRIIILR